MSEGLLVQPQCTRQAVQALEMPKNRMQVVLLHSFEGPHRKALQKICSHFGKVMTCRMVST